MKFEDINIRDPYILKTQEKYYLYGTRSETTWGIADGFDCYESVDMVEWVGPFEIFHKTADFPYDRSYWAPECYEWNGKYYLITTLGAEHKKKGVYALVSDSPKGPFTMHSKGALSPEGWCCIDGTLHWEEDGEIYLIFSHSFEDILTGDMVAVQLSSDLATAIGEPRILFNAVEAPWAKPIPFAKQEFGIDEDVYFTDGPCSYRMKNKELMIVWSSWSDQGYAVGMAVSNNGSINGSWSHIEKKLYPGNGGHGMVFTSPEGTLGYLMHYPNEKYLERPHFYEIKEVGTALELK